ncbi:MAG: hypothetical protein HKUEN07_34290 [Rhodocyclaceae bacterium]|nr:MAG: hypothetical protein HKUEN07_34290 [Rhodocyclaceae bacterium]
MTGVQTCALPISEVFNDALAKVRMAVGSIANRVIEDFLPAMNQMAEGMVE